MMTNSKIKVNFKGDYIIDSFFGLDYYAFTTEPHVRSIYLNPNLTNKEKLIDSYLKKSSGKLNNIYTPNVKKLLSIEILDELNEYNDIDVIVSMNFTQKIYSMEIFEKNINLYLTESDKLSDCFESLNKFFKVSDGYFLTGSLENFPPDVPLKFINFVYLDSKRLYVNDLKYYRIMEIPDRVNGFNGKDLEKLGLDTLDQLLNPEELERYLEEIEEEKKPMNI
jgi:hypothetical protein